MLLIEFSREGEQVGLFANCQRAEAIGNAEVRQKLAAIGVDLQGSTRDELRAYMRTEHERWGAVARDIGLQPE